MARQSLRVLLRRQCWKKHGVKWQGIRFSPWRPILLCWICFQVSLLPLSPAVKISSSDPTLSRVWVSGCQGALAEVEDSFRCWASPSTLSKTVFAFPGPWPSRDSAVSSFCLPISVLSVLFHRPFVWGSESEHREAGLPRKQFTHRDVTSLHFMTSQRKNTTCITWCLRQRLSCY